MTAVSKGVGAVARIPAQAAQLAVGAAALLRLAPGGGLAIRFVASRK